MGPAVGDVLGGKYTLLGVLGRGGMGVVFEARQADLGRLVAVKVFAEEAGAQSPDLARFQRESQMLAKVATPNIVSVLDFHRGDAQTPPYVVMELLRGKTLGELVRANVRLEPARAANIGMQLLEALEAAHSQGVIHRDVKPANVFCVDTLGGDFVKLLDFGVAKDLTESRGLTAPGSVVGTLTYMAPEQLLGERVSFQADVYAVGATLYYALAGKRPFDAPSPADLLRAILYGEPEPLASLRPDAGELARVVHTALAKDPGARYPSARAMHEALSAIVGRALPGRLSGGVEGPPSTNPTRPIPVSAPASARAPEVIDAPPSSRPYSPTLASSGTDRQAPPTVPYAVPDMTPPLPALPVAPREGRSSTGLVVVAALTGLVALVAVAGAAWTVTRAPLAATTLADAGPTPVATAIETTPAPALSSSAPPAPSHAIAKATPAPHGSTSAAPATALDPLPQTSSASLPVSAPSAGAQYSGPHARMSFFNGTGLAPERYDGEGLRRALGAETAKVQWSQCFAPFLHTPPLHETVLLNVEVRKDGSVGDIHAPLGDFSLVVPCLGSVFRAIAAGTPIKPGPPGKLQVTFTAECPTFECR